MKAKKVDFILKITLIFILTNLLKLRVVVLSINFKIVNMKLFLKVL